MKIQCDMCGRVAASIFCCADEAALCDDCDRKVHHANKLACKHQRLSLSSSEQTHPVCDICKEKRAFVFCQEDRAILCWDCDDPIHTANRLTMKHSRFLLTGARLSASPLGEPDYSSNFNKLTKEDQEKAFLGKSVTVEDSTVISGSSSISEYLIKTLPGYRVEDLLFDDADELSKNDEMMPLLQCDLGVRAAEFPIWVPQVPQIQSLNNFISTGVNGWIHFDYKALNQNQQHHYELEEGNFKGQWSDDSSTVPQISTPVSTNNKRARIFSASDF